MCICYSQEVSELELVCHLLQLLWSRETLTVRLLLPASEMIENIQSGRCSRALINAACACTTRFSVHKMRDGSSVASLGETLATRARQEVDLADLAENGIDAIRTYCLLVEFAASRGNGGLAWIDIGTFRLEPSSEHCLRVVPLMPHDLKVLLAAF